MKKKKILLIILILIVVIGISSLTVFKILNDKDRLSVNERQWINNNKNNVISINVTREGYISPLEVSEQVHITELALNDYKDFDYEVINSSIEQLKDDIMDIIDSEVSKNEIHD